MGVRGQSERTLSAMLYREDIKINTANLPICQLNPVAITNNIYFDRYHFTGKFNLTNNVTLVKVDFHCFLGFRVKN